MVIRSQKSITHTQKRKRNQTQHKNSHQIIREETKEEEMNRKELPKQSQNNLCQ